MPSLPSPRHASPADMAGGRGVRRFIAGDRGNVAVIFALMIPVLVLSLGGGLDYISAARREDTLNGIADAAALAATTPAQMQQSCVVPSSASCLTVKAAALALFNAQTAGVQGVGAVTPAITIVDSATTPTKRTATVTYTGASNNAFAGVLGFRTMRVAGIAVAKNTLAPVTTFYMLIDESPSMAFPAQQSGVTTMINATPNNGTAGYPKGCALGCHAAAPAAYIVNQLWNASNVVCNGGDPSGTFPSGYVAFPCKLTIPNAKIANTSDAKGKALCAVGTINTGGGYNSASSVFVSAIPTLPYKDGNGVNYTSSTTPGGPQTIGEKVGGKFTTHFGMEDNFALSRCLGVQLRVDLVNQAVAALMTTAPATATQNNTTYAVDLYTLDLGDNNTPNKYEGEAITNPSVANNTLNTIYTYPIATNLIDFQTNAQMTTNFSTAAATATSKLKPLETWSNGQRTSGGGTSDDDSYIDTVGLSGLYGIMPTPGTGGSAPGDTPQEVLFIVSDGMNDVNGSNPNATGTCSTSSSLYFGRPLFCVNATQSGKSDYCSLIKAKGIKIAFLYLRYNALNPYDGPSNPGYFQDIEPFQYPGDKTNTTNNFTGQTDEVEQAAIGCASAGLEFTVDTGGDITTAMNALFQKAVQTAYLSH